MMCYLVLMRLAILMYICVCWIWTYSVTQQRLQLWNLLHYHCHYEKQYLCQQDWNIAPSLRDAHQNKILRCTLHCL